MKALRSLFRLHWFNYYILLNSYIKIALMCIRASLLPFNIIMDIRTNFIKNVR